VAADALRPSEQLISPGGPRTDGRPAPSYRSTPSVSELGCAASL
jgi:hypothetical protein